jgi:DNA repair exonuclease SbcCD ATPase subunit
MSDDDDVTLQDIAEQFAGLLDDLTAIRQSLAAILARLESIDAKMEAKATLAQETKAAVRRALEEAEARDKRYGRA